MFRGLRWLAVILPGAFIGLLELFGEDTLDRTLTRPWDVLVVVGIVMSLAWLFSRQVFGRIDALSGAAVRQNAELERRNATLRALHRVSLAITSMRDLDAVLDVIVDQARVLLSADGAALLVDAEAVEPQRRSTSGLDVTMPLAGGSRLEAPLRRAGATFGSLVVASADERAYGADELETLASLANQAATAIEQARLQERLRGLAVADERERIAREMHDGLAQVLGYVNTKTQAVENLLEQGRVPEARSQLDQLAAAARSIYVDVREAILGLRSAIDPGIGLVPAIEAYASRIAQASQLVITVSASKRAREVKLAETAERHVFRIVQEALTNVRKHARAQRVGIDIDGLGDEHLLVEIGDDGHGMAGLDAPAIDWPHYGLASMRERAAAMGATIDWIARPATGTTVRLVVPVAPSASVQPIGRIG